jgi:hypothetical protein
VRDFDVEKEMKTAMLLLLAAAAGGAALAQSGGAVDPRAPEVRVPAATYESAFRDYRPYREQELASWREVNEEVARVGGHIGVMKNAGKPDKPQKDEKPAAGAHQGMHR